MSALLGEIFFFLIATLFGRLYIKGKGCLGYYLIFFFFYLSPGYIEFTWPIFQTLHIPYLEVGVHTLPPISPATFYSSLGRWRQSHKQDLDFLSYLAISCSITSLYTLSTCLSAWALHVLDNPAVGDRLQVSRASYLLF